MSKMQIVKVTSIIGLAVLSACAKNPDKIAPAYVSPLTYQSYTCEQLTAEAQRVSQRAAGAVGAQRKEAKNDAVATGVGVVLFWPALLFIGRGSGNEAEVARLKGEIEAIERASIEKNCNITFKRQ